MKNAIETPAAVSFKMADLAAARSLVFDDKGRVIPFQKFMGETVKDSAAWVTKKTAYNHAKRLVEKAVKASLDDTTVKVRLLTSLVSPDKHGATQSAGYLEDSPMQRLAEKERDAKALLYATARAKRLLPSESGLSDKEYWTLARHNGHVSPSWKRETSTGNLAYNAAAQAAWLAWLKAGIHAERKEKETPKVSKPATPKKKKNKAA